MKSGKMKVIFDTTNHLLECSSQMVSPVRPTLLQDVRHVVVGEEGIFGRVCRGGSIHL